MSEPWGEPEDARRAIEAISSQVSQKIATETVTCSVASDNVSVTMGLDQRLRDVTIERGAARMYGPEKLGVLVTEALQQAHDQSQQRLFEVVGETQMFGVSLTEMMTVMSEDPTHITTLFDR